MITSALDKSPLARRMRPAPSEAQPQQPGAVATALPPTMCESDAARYINMSAAWLKKSRTSRFSREVGAPPFIRCGRRRIAYLRADLDSWLEARRQSPGSGFKE